MTCRRSNMKSSISSGLRVSRKLVAIQFFALLLVTQWDQLWATRLCQCFEGHRDDDSWQGPHWSKAGQKRKLFRVQLRRL